MFALSESERLGSPSAFLFASPPPAAAAAAMSANPPVAAFGFAKQQSPEFIVAIDAPAAEAVTGSSVGGQQCVSAPVAPIDVAVPLPYLAALEAQARARRVPTELHHNPELLDGFLLDGGSAPLPSTPTPQEGKRKRKARSAPDACEDGSADAVAAGNKRSKRGKSLLVVRTDLSMSEDSVSSGQLSPLLQLLQQGNAATTEHFPASVSDAAARAPNKTERAEQRRQKAALKAQRLEARIARLTAQVSATRAQEEQAMLVAHHMAEEAARAALLATQYSAQATSDAGMVDAFFAAGDESAHLSVPDVSSFSSAASSASSLPPLSPMSAGITATASTASVGDGSMSPVSMVRGRSGGGGGGGGEVDARTGDLLGSASPVLSLDDAVDAALQTGAALAVGDAADVAALASFDEHIRRLHWAEQACHLRVAQRALGALEASIDEPASALSSAPLLLRFLDEHSECFSLAQARAAMQSLQQQQQHSEAGVEDVESAELHASLHEVSAMLLAKSRAQQSAFHIVA